MLHSAVPHGRIMGFIFIMTEDGGEMIIASVMLWYVFILALRNPSSYHSPDEKVYFLDCLLRK